MAAVQISFVKKLQTKLLENYYTSLNYKNEIIFVPSFVFIGAFLRPCCFRKILRILSRGNRHYMQFSNFLKFYLQKKIGTLNFFPGISSTKVMFWRNRRKIDFL